MIAQSQVCRYPVPGLSLRAWCHWSHQQSLSVTGDLRAGVFWRPLRAAQSLPAPRAASQYQSPEVSILTDILTDTEETVSCNSWLLSEQADTDWAYLVYTRSQRQWAGRVTAAMASVTSCSSTERSLVSSGHTALWDRRQTSSSTSLGRFGSSFKGFQGLPQV